MTLSSTYQSIEHVWVPMPDGVRLSARLWLPSEWVDEQVRVPTILEYIPYRKRDMVRARDERNHPVFASDGYACVRVDMRGSGDSEGCFTDMYSRAELDDAREVIAWIRQQDWCNGGVGMMGTSWGGTSALQAAVADIPGLRAIIAVCATDNRYQDDIHHMGGCLLTDTVEWGVTLPAIIAMPPSPEVVGENWREVWRERLENLSFPLENWIEHETCDEYWRWGSVSETPGGLACPTLAIGGWSDRYSNTVMNLVADNPQQCWGIVGPWGHHYPDVGNPGPALDFQTEALHWWDRWLKDEPNGADSAPRLRVWCREFDPPGDFLDRRRGRWISEQAWPIADADSLELSLNSPAGESGWAEIPEDLTVGKQSGDTGYFGRHGGLPLDQADDDRHSLIFESEPLQQDLDIFGRIELDLQLEAEKQRSVVVARISDLSADGSACRVCFVIRNLSLDPDFVARNEEIGGKKISETLIFTNLAYRIRRGHRLRLALSTAYWPMIWPMPESSRVKINCAQIRLRLPGWSSTNDDPVTRSLHEIDLVHAPISNIERKQVFDQNTKELIQGWYLPLNETELSGVDQGFGSETRAEHRILEGQAESASSVFEHRLSARYPECKVEVQSRGQLTADSAHFYPRVTIRVLEDQREIFTRDWSRKIPRKFG